MKFTYFLCLLVIFVVGYFLLCKTDTNKCPPPPSPEFPLIVPSTLNVILGPYNSHYGVYDYAIFHGASRVPITTLSHSFVTINTDSETYPTSWKPQNYVTDPIYGTNGFYAVFSNSLLKNSNLQFWAVVGNEQQSVPVSFSIKV
jgi:hypothetical protein